MAKTQGHFLLQCLHKASSMERGRRGEQTRIGPAAVEIGNAAVAAIAAAEAVVTAALA